MRKVGIPSSGVQRVKVIDTQKLILLVETNIQRLTEPTHKLFERTITWESNTFQLTTDTRKIVASNYDIDVLLDNCDRTLFRSYLNITHCLHHLLPDKRDRMHAVTLRHPMATIFRYLASSFFMRETHL